MIRKLARAGGGSVTGGHRGTLNHLRPHMFSAGCLQLVSLKSLLVSVLGCLALLTAVAWGQPQASYRIDTFAGLTGVGDGGPSIAAVLRFPTGVAVDGAGNLYIADRSNHRIRKVGTTGTITTIAGTGESGFSGDGGDAVQAQLNFPYGVAVDSAGNLYIADTSNHRIRKVGTTGTITTIAKPSSTSPMAWRWTARATFTSPIGATSASARSIPRERSPPLRARGRAGLAGTAARRSRRSSTFPVA